MAKGTTMVADLSGEEAKAGKLAICGEEIGRPLVHFPQMERNGDKDH